MTHKYSFGVAKREKILLSIIMHVPCCGYIKKQANEYYYGSRKNHVPLPTNFYFSLRLSDHCSNVFDPNTLLLL